MTMHPELDHAFDMGVSMQEVVEIFAKHHRGPTEDQYRYDCYWDSETTHKSSEFWEHWHPLFRKLYFSLAKRWTIDHHGPSSNIHRALTQDVISWLCDSKRNSNVYLINEPWMPWPPIESTGDYSRAAVMGGICSDAQRFGQSINFQHDGRYVNINQLIAALASAYPPYRHILTQILINYPGVWDHPPRSLFKKLIHEPWKAVQLRYPEYITTPPVVVFSYNESHVQEDLFRLICEFDSPPHSSPLLWIISVGPDSKLPIRDLVDLSVPRYFQTHVCYNDALADAELVLHHKFSYLRLHRYYQTFNDNEVWPSNEQITQLARIVLGVFEFTDVIIQFVDWEGDGGPRAHLETFLGYMVDSPTPSDGRRYCALDHFYIRALSSIPPDVFLDVKKAFSIIRWQRTPMHSAQLLSLGCFRFDTFLPYFYRIVSSKLYHDEESRTNHFSRFLEDPNLSGKFYTPASESCLQAYQTWLHFLNHSSDPHIILRPRVLRRSQVDLTNGDKIEKLKLLAQLGLCDLWIAGANKALLLCDFDFRCLAQNCDSLLSFSFLFLINVLYKWDEATNDSPGIVRVEPVSNLDSQFVDKCQGLAEPLKLGDMNILPCTDPKYVLLGYGSATVLAIITSVGRFYGSMRGICLERGGEVTIYTSAMLDYM